MEKFFLGICPVRSVGARRESERNQSICQLYEKFVVRHAETIRHTEEMVRMFQEHELYARFEPWPVCRTLRLRGHSNILGRQITNGFHALGLLSSLVACKYEP